MSARLARITVFPVKSLDGVDVHEAKVNGGAGLDHDREYRFADADGAPINGKRLGERIIGIRSSFDFAFGELEMRDGEESLRARLPEESDSAAAWLGERLGVEARLEHNTETGFPDDESATGPTLISRATLEEIGGWFDLEPEEMRRRVRANLVIDDVPAFWEDRLFGPEGEVVEFRIGDVRIEGVNPCQRCTVPSRDSRTGEIGEPTFAKLFAEARKKSLPEWAEQSCFDHFYRVAVNTKIPASENGKVLAVGDELHVA